MKGKRGCKLVIVGCGRISASHIKAVCENVDIGAVAFCDVDREKAQGAARTYLELVQDVLNKSDNSMFREQKGSVYVDYKKMLERELIDIAAICTESGYHAEIAIECMKKGIHVIVEKPMALSSEDADRMIEVAKENNVKLCVSHQNRFNPPIQKLRQALEQGRFGKLIAANARILWNRDQGYYSQAPWRGTYELDGGCLMNQCIHNIDLLQWMMGGDIQWVHGVTANYMHPYIEAEDYGSIQIGFDNGAIGNVEGTVCVYPKNLEETLTIIGEKGMVSIGGLAVNKIETWRFADGLDTEEEVMAECNGDVDSVYGNGHTPLYQDMIEAIRDDREPYINGEAGKKAMEIILAAYKSSKKGKRILFPVTDLSSLEFKSQSDNRNGE